MRLGHDALQIDRNGDDDGRVKDAGTPTSAARKLDYSLT
jgi:hypothetical protein